MFVVSDLQVSVENTQILSDFSLKISRGEIHALMGHNGSGKSTLAQTVMGNPVYAVTKGSILFEGDDISELSPNERSQKGIFLSFQHPSEVTGVTVGSYLRTIYNSKHDTKLSPVNFRKFIKEKLELLDMSEAYLERYLNDGFSGGEKKRMEMLQMLLLEPKLAILDEVDSGLDIDALKIVSDAVNYLHTNNQTAVLLITHYTRILKYIQPEFVHVMKSGKIVKSGDSKLAHELEEKGYADY